MQLPDISYGVLTIIQIIMYTDSDDYMDFSKTVSKFQIPMPPWNNTNSRSDFYAAFAEKPFHIA